MKYFIWYLLSIGLFYILFKCVESFIKKTKFGRFVDLKTTKLAALLWPITLFLLFVLLFVMPVIRERAKRAVERTIKEKKKVRILKLVDKQ